MLKFIFSSLICVFSISSMYASPKLEIIGGDTYDWKKVTSKQSPLQAEIVLKNTGDEKLIIKEVRPGCGCTTAPLDKNELNPGETAKMSVKLNLTATQGPLTKSITITSNDPQNERKILFLKAEIVNPITVSPTTYFTFPDLMVGIEKESKLTVKNTSNIDIKFSDIKIDPENLPVNFKGEKTLKPGEEMEIAVKAKPEKKGYFNCTVTIKTSHPDFPELKLTGYGNVKESPVFNN